MPPDGYGFLSKRVVSVQVAQSSYCSANRTGFRDRLRCMVEISLALRGLRDVPVGRDGLAERHDGRAQVQIPRPMNHPRIGPRSATRFLEVYRMRTVFVNGSYVPENEAQISIFDRGSLFGDAVYEVTSVLDGKLVEYEGHMTRLRRSLDELKLPSPATDEELLEIHRELVKRNDLTEGLIYLQISRGAADRDFLFPGPDVKPTLLMFPQKKSLINSALAERGQKIILVEDLRWRRCDIKTVQLLYASMVKNQAHDAGADDAWMVLDGEITEGSSNNAYIVTEDGTIVTRDLSTDILHGITRKSVLQCAAELQLKVEERPFTVAEAKAAAEAFSTSATSFVNPVIEIDGSTIGEGKPGPIAQRLRQVYIETSKAAGI